MLNDSREARPGSWHVRVLLVSLALYVFALVPFLAIAAVLEGAARGMWGLSSPDWAYQLGAFAALWLFPLLLLGPLAACLLYLLWVIASKRHQSTGPLLGAVLGPLALCIAAPGLYLIGEAAIAYALVRLFPVALITGAVLYGVSVGVVLRRQQRGHAA
jgi:hypothetical protein